jgi:AcrR family transcriptional regulator
MGHETQKTARKPRADALRNREKLLDSAGRVFSSGGPGASLEAVARGAGVGIGTLYRHFPTREALFQAVYRHEVDELVALSARLAAEGPPLDALRRWLHAAVRMVATKRGMIAALTPVLDGADPVFTEQPARMRAAAGDLMRIAVAEGALRRDVTPEDLMRAVIGICHAGDRDGWQETAIRLIDIFVDGLRARGADGA